MDKNISVSEALDQVTAYHERTKHQPRAMARGPGGLDWANQPSPFRVYEGAIQIELLRQGFSHVPEGAGQGAQEALVLPSPLS